MYYRYISDAGRESLVIHGEGISAAVPGSHTRFAELAGYLRDHADASVLIPSTDTFQVEGIQAVIWHSMCR